MPLQIAARLGRLGMRNQEYSLVKEYKGATYLQLRHSKMGGERFNESAVTTCVLIYYYEFIDPSLRKAR